jgi:glutamate 5-kinase
VAVDPGAAEALLRKGKSLLPTGVVGVSGTFAEGEAVDVVHAGAPDRPFARWLIRYSAAQMRQIIGGSSASISKTLGFSSGDAVVHRDDLVLLEV